MNKNKHLNSPLCACKNWDQRSENRFWKGHSLAKKICNIVFSYFWTISHQIDHCAAAAAQRHFLSVNLQNFARGIGCACWHLHLDLGERCSKAVGIPASAMVTAVRRGVGPACGPAAACLCPPCTLHCTAGGSGCMICLALWRKLVPPSATTFPPRCVMILRIAACKEEKNNALNSVESATFDFWSWSGIHPLSEFKFRLLLDHGNRGRFSLSTTQ